MNSALRLTEEVAADIRARVKSLDFGAIEKARKAKEENGTFDVIISTEDIDRAGEIVKQSGWELTNYKNNPIVLWGHDYYSLPVGVCTDTYLTEKNGIPALGARGVFLSADINPFAQQVRKLYEFGIKAGQGVGCTTSVGFIPKEFDENARNTITKAVLLEFSFVPVPANQGVGPAAGRALTFDEARTLGIDMVGMRSKGMSFAEIAGVIPKELGEKVAEEKTSWKKPALKDFTDKSWTELSDTEKTAIAGHFAYIKDAMPANFEDCKLPYRRASDGAIVLNGLKSAMKALADAVELPADRKAVYDHLAAMYKLFKKDAPEFKTLKEAQAGDTCEMDDGAPGILTTDPKDPDGALVCMPLDQDKTVKAGGQAQKTLTKALNDEHDRHVGEIDKALDQGDMKDFRSSMQDEQIMHRAKTIACFRAFEPEAEKSFDKNEHLKALRDEHNAYEMKCTKAMDEYENKSVAEEHMDALSGALEVAQRVHKKAVTRIAKAMCKAAFGEEDQADEKTLDILKEFLAPHIDAQLLPAVIGKIGVKLAAEKKATIAVAYEHLKSAKAVLEACGLGDGDGEEARSTDVQTPVVAPAKQRSRPAGVPAKDELDAHLLAREVLRGITTAASSGLETINNRLREQSNK